MHHVAIAVAHHRRGTGCWGEWDLSVPYSVPAAASGKLQAYELPAADGSPINLTEYPVTLTPRSGPAQRSRDARVVGQN